ncbi:MAG: hypothetical protein K9G49_14765 [Taibaiella sp.]|nr:hypothetical protein [Taibaiella sp.]
MNLIYIVAIILQAGILVYFISRILKSRSNKKKASDIPVFATEYERTRYTALHVTQQQLNLDIPQSVTKVYGVVMDWDMNGVVLTLSAYITGAANVALSNGASVMGGGKNPAVAEQASEFVQVAQNYLLRAVPVSDTILPAIGTVKFYLLTNRGIYSAQELLSAIDDQTSPWVGLFFRGNMVVNEIKNGGGQG